MNRIEWIKGCLLVGVVGDALGAPVELLEWSAIRATFSAQGIVNYTPAYEVIEKLAEDYRASAAGLFGYGEEFNPSIEMQYPRSSTCR